MGSRALQGASYGLFPLSIGVLRDELPRERLIPGMAIVSGTLGVGGAVGLIVTGVLTSGGGDYRSIFWFSLVAVAIALLLTLAVVPRRPTSIRFGGIDWWGTLVLATGLVLFLLPLSEGHVWGWTSPATLGCFIASLLVLLGFLGLERRTPTRWWPRSCWRAAPFS